MSESGKFSSPSGFVLLYKPVGPGSQSLLGSIRRLAGTRRVGHGGTLDPFALGLLPVAVGRATRLVDRLHSFPKTYEAELRLGIETDTLDVEGEVLSEVDPPPLVEAEVRRRLDGFLGVREQIPPAYSAARVAGRRAYDLARAGQEVALAPRTISIHELSLLGLGADRLTFRVRCTSGTYVRALGRDIALALGTVGHLTRLIRTGVGPFRLGDALTVAEVQGLVARFGLGRALLPPDALLEDLPCVGLTEPEVALVLNGAMVPHDGLPSGTRVRAYGGDGRLLAVLEAMQSGLRPRLLLQ